MIIWYNWRTFWGPCCQKTGMTRIVVATQYIGVIPLYDGKSLGKRKICS